MEFGSLKKYSVHIAIITAFIAGIFPYTTLRCPLSAWIGPAALIYATRSVSIKKSALISITVIMVSSYLGFITPINVAMSKSIYCIFLVAAVLLFNSLTNALPFIIDRLFYEKIGTVRQLFIFPLTLTTLSFLRWMLPIGSATSFAYSQTGFLWFAQGLSIYGMLGMVFLLGWFATSVDLFIRAIPTKNKDVRWSAVCAVVIVAVIIFGGIRLATADDPKTVNVLFAEGPSGGETEGMTLDGQIEIFDQVFKTAVRENAEMIVFCEESFFLKEEWISPFETHAANSVKSTGIYLIFACDIEEGSVKYNTCTFVTPENGIEWRYNKTNLTPTLEQDIMPGDGTIYFTDTKLGRITAVICNDLNFNYFINGIDKDADILIAPSFDWIGLEEWNTKDNSFRTIENGVSLIKPTLDGTSATYDQYGRLIDTYTSFDNPAGTTHMVKANTEGCRTFYSEYGHIIDWTFVICTVLLLLSCIYTCMNGRGKRQ